jgi:rubrerythrin
MNDLNWADEIIDFAIDREVESNKFYGDLANRMENPAIQKLFADFAEEELGHKAKLEALKAGGFQVGQQKQVQSLRIADYVVDVEPTPDMGYSDALIVAMKKEKAAFKLYLDLAAVAATEEATDTFLWLAGEEAKHKLQFEIEYDDFVLKEA